MRIMANGETFEKKRVVLGFTQRELAKRSKLSYSYISLIERSVKSVGPKAAKRLCELLECPFEELFRIER